MKRILNILFIFTISFFNTSPLFSNFKVHLLDFGRGLAVGALMSELQNNVKRLNNLPDTTSTDTIKKLQEHYSALINAIYYMNILLDTNKTLTPSITGIIKRALSSKIGYHLNAMQYVH